MKAIRKKAAMRVRRKKRVRKNIFGTSDKPRLSVFRSSKHIYVQVIDDKTGQTLAAASSLSGEIKGEMGELNKRDSAKKVGALAAQKCSAAGIDTVIFDRNGYLYCGRVAAVADGAREGGLKF